LLPSSAVHLDDVILVNEAVKHIAAADLSTEQPQQLASATHQRPVQRFHPYGRHRRTATTLDSAPWSGIFGAV
jgi:hypothetical protein